MELNPMNWDLKTGAITGGALLTGAVLGKAAYDYFATSSIAPAAPVLEECDSNCSCEDMSSEESVSSTFMETLQAVTTSARDKLANKLLDQKQNETLVRVDLRMKPVADMQEIASVKPVQVSNLQGKTFLEKAFSFTKAVVVLPVILFALGFNAISQWVNSLFSMIFSKKENKTTAV